MSQKATEIESQAAVLEALLRKIAGGDRSAFALFYDRTSRHVYGLVLKILRRPESAEEAALDVYLQAWQTAASYDPERGSPLAWLLTIARSRAIDSLRSQASRGRLKLLPDAREVADWSGNPENAGMLEERRRALLFAMRNLPEEQRRSIELAFFTGMTHQEIAASSGEPLGTVKTRIRIGMMKLRDSLKQFEV